MSVPQWSSELTACPECAEVAEITDRFTLVGATGRVEHVRVACILGHRFCLPQTAWSPRSPGAHRPDPSGEAQAPAA